MDAFVFSAQVETPVLAEVAVADQGAELEDGFGAVQSPPGPCDVHAVFDQVTACSFDDAGGDRPPFGQGGGVVQVRLLRGEVVRAGVGTLPLGRGVAEGSGAAPDSPCDLGRLALEDLGRLGCDPRLGVRVAFTGEGPGGLPRVLNSLN